jgi:hypothetical protein
MPSLLDRYVPRLRRLMCDPDAASSASLESDELSQRAKWVSHFRQPGRPRLFSSDIALRSLVENICMHRPLWRDRTLAAVERDRTVGLPIYATTGPKLDARFPWGALPPGPGKDALYSVRPHRFAFAPRWALAIVYGAPVAKELADILDGWRRFAASGHHNLAYLSTLVVIQRVLALSSAWAVLEARAPESTEDEGLLEFRILQILEADLRFLAPKLGSSYPNNHLLLDRFAKWLCAALWPELMPTRSLKHDERLWLDELERQTFEDGSGYEHSLHYHEYACEMAVLYLRLCQVNGWPAPQSIIDRVGSMLRFQADLAGPESIPIAIGNATEDPLLPLDSSEGWATTALREIYRAWYDAAAAPALANEPAVERAFWLLGGKLVEGAHSPAPAAPSICRSGGFAIFPDTDAASRLTMRTGPAPGAPLSPGHVHADLLSIYLSVSSTPIIIDAGTYTYRRKSREWQEGSPGWRRYFVGPRAHNGPAIGDADPLGALERNFRPSAFPARARLAKLHRGGRLSWTEAEIETAGAYTGWRRGVIHIRDEYWLIYDILPNAVRPGEASIALQFPPEAVVTERSPSDFSVSVGAAAVDIAVSAGLQGARILVGETDPLGGWVSRAYGQLEAAPQLRLQVDTAIGLSAFVLKHTQAAPISAIESAKLNAGIGLRVACRNHIDTFLLSRDADAARLDAWDVEFRGVLAWLRNSGAGTEEFVWIHGQALSCGTRSVRASSVVPMLAGRAGPQGMELRSIPEEAIAWVLHR